MAPYDSRSLALAPALPIAIVPAQADEATLREMTSELQRANQALEQLVYVAAHDLQEPLRMMASFTELFARRYHDVVDETGQQYLQYARNGAQQMKALINDLVEYSHICNDESPSTLVALSKVAEDAEYALRGLLSDSNATLEIGSLPEVKGNPRQLRQVFYNLLRNCILYRDERRPLEITVKAQRATGGWQIEVRDNGLGIPAQYHERVAMIFQRLPRDRAVPGTGMGLPICKKVIELHDGRMWLESNQVHGTRVLFTLPALA